MATSLIETMSGPFDPTPYHDEYREALQAVIDAKLAGREVVKPEGEQPTAGTVVDLMAALRASVEAAKKQQAGGQEKEERAPAKKTAAKKPAKKTAAKKAAKAPARKKSA